MDQTSFLVLINEPYLCKTIAFIETELKSYKDSIFYLKGSANLKLFQNKSSFEFPCGYQKTDTENIKKLGYVRKLIYIYDYHIKVISVA